MTEHTLYCERCQHQLCTKRVPIFSSLDQQELSEVASLIHKKKYAQGELLFMEGDSLDSLIILNTGQVKAYRNTNEGKEQILYIFSHGDFLGEKNLLKNQKATYHVEALEETKTCAITKNDFQKLLGKHPGITAKIMEELCGRLQQLETMIEHMGSKDVDTRINAVLIQFADKYGKQHEKGILIDLPLSREGIASYIGLTRETVSRKLSGMQNDGAIEMIGNKKILIYDINALEDSTW